MEMIITMSITIKTSFPLKLTSTSNTRDLGGYLKKDGSKTKSKMYLRSDSLSGLNQEDKDYIYNYGVRLVVDLRTSSEIDKQPGSLIGYKDIKYINIPLVDDINSNDFIGKFPKSMAEMYIGLLDHSQTLISSIFKEMAQFSDSCVLFNCSAGKDRTGVISMLLLKLAGVEDNVIVADYAKSEHFMKEAFVRHQEVLFKAGITYPSYILRSEPKTMKATLKHFNRKYESSESYMRVIGLTIDEIEALREKL